MFTKPSDSLWQENEKSSQFRKEAVGRSTCAPWGGDSLRPRCLQIVAARENSQWKAKNMEANERVVC